MKFLMSISRAIDSLNLLVGRVVYWLLLVAVAVSAGNAVMRYTISYSSNALLEIQWYLVSAVFMLCAGYAFLHGAHVRIDLVAGRLGHRFNAWIDVVGIPLMMLPVCALLLVFGWDTFLLSWQIDEVSTDAGGLTRWPVKGLIPAGFALLILQAISEWIKRVAFLRGMGTWQELGGGGHGAHDPDGSVAADAR